MANCGWTSGGKALVRVIRRNNLLPPPGTVDEAEARARSEWTQGPNFVPMLPSLWSQWWRWMRRRNRYIERRIAGWGFYYRAHPFNQKEVEADRKAEATELGAGWGP